MALFGSIAQLRTQVADAKTFAPVFAYLEDLFRADSAAGVRLQQIAAGETQRQELPGGAFALEQVYVSKPRTDGFFESHRAYVDVQVIVEGEEAMEVADVAALAERVPYDGTRDLIVYHDSPGASRLRLRAGEAAIFFPSDAHMPGLHETAGPALVRKTVVKVPVRA